MSLVTAICILIAFLIFMLILLWVFIFFTVNNNKIAQKKRKIFEDNFLQGIITSYSNIEIETTNKKLKRLKRYIKKDSEVLWKSARIFVKINRVVKFSKKQQFQNIFEYLDVSPILKEKIKDKDWYVKAKAIWLSYEFELEKNAQTVIPYRDDENTLVRREAQIALVSFIGWKSLVFFPYVTRPMSLWQQIRIIEKLEETEDELDLQYLDKALLSENEIIKELLIRIIRKFKLEQYKYYVIEQLFSKDKKLLRVALQVLKSFDMTRKEIKGIETRFDEIISGHHRTDIYRYLQTTIYLN